MKIKYALISLLAIAFMIPAMAFADDYEGENAEAPQTINAYDGVYWYADRLETYYSSAVAYHYRTAEWWLDDEGFYRTQEGYYVVSASDYEQGSVIEGSKGLCMVLDSGCDDGITDYYVNW